MSYVDATLIPAERVTHRARLSRMMFLGPTVVGSVALLLLFGSPPLGLIVLTVAAIWGVARYVDFSTSEFAVTDKRVIIKVGLLRRRTLEMQLSKIEAVAVNQGILARICKYGDITVTGTGGTKERFVGIGGPLEFRRAVQIATG